MKKILVLAAIGLVLLANFVHASDFHANDEGHRLVYVVTDSSGNPVTGQTVRLAVQKSSDGSFLDFNDNSFKTSGWTTRLATLTYEPVGEYYYRVLSIDQAVRVSNDFACIISNDDATYGDQQVEVVSFSDIKSLIKIHR